MKNPFNVMYGMIPTSLVNRNDAYEKIIGAFNDENAVASSYLITGIRGSGKTVLLRGLAKELSEEKGWLTVDLNPQGDFISSLAERLYEEIKRHKLPFDWSIDFSLPNLTFRLSKEKESLSAENAIPKLLDIIVKKDRRILLLIDEVNSTKDFKFFANFYQRLIGENYPLFLLMTGLYENVGALISDKASSFLARTPKMVLGPLDLSVISRMYQKELGADLEGAIELAKLSKGYAFAYQVIGKLCFEKHKTRIDDELLRDVDDYLADNGYNVIWKGMTRGEKEICLALAKVPSGAISEIMEITKLKVNNFNNFRARMIYKGFLLPNGYGKLSFALPRFKEFVLRIEPFFE